ncbi:hypothetical protein A6E13_16455 [Aliivibrio fischeri]|uniref:XRE family transcriptional regulator n=1 Tax=Aliivibrio fischeri TaxID=668 RepID=UPI00080DE149|nr:XRE family transcriptional regulator [Aliivibrio fischeri]OCH31813.1 hypothetical protein A6E13_16455 [Aliivibrio fischeri]
MNRNEEFGKRLRELRKEKEIKDGRKLTCEMVGKAIGMTPSGYTNYENGLRIPKLDIIEDIAIFYKVSPSYIACFSENKGNSTNESLLIMPQLTEQAKAESASILGDYAVSPELLLKSNINKENILLELIKDNSMSPHLFKNDFILIKKENLTLLDNLAFGIYCLKDKNNQLWIRWVKPELDGSYKVYPNNTTHYESYTFSKEEFSEFRILGSIFKIIRTPNFDDI